MIYNEEFWLEVDSFFTHLKGSLDNQVNLFGSELELISKMGSTWFTVPIPDKMRDLLLRFNFLGIDDINVSKYNVEDIELLSIKSKFLSELKIAESSEDKRFLVLLHIKNSSEKDISDKVKQLLKSLCVYPTLDEMLYNTDMLLKKGR